MNVDRIALSNQTFEGQNNAYLLAGAETVLIDTGDGTAETAEALAAALADRGIEFADVDRVLLTHWHGDHRGLAGRIQAAGGATVHAHPADADLVAGDTDAWRALERLYHRLFERWGMPRDKQAAVAAVFSSMAWTDESPTVTPVESGDRLRVGDRIFEVVPAPGHTAGSCLFATDDGEALTGDALLPTYTPNVGGADVRLDGALAAYLDTLEAIEAAGYDRAWPGHRAPIDDPASRAAEIRKHHEQRAYRVLAALDRLGPSDAWTVSAELFGELEDIHILHGPGEAAAHLHHLAAAGAVARDGDTYRLAVDADALAAADGRWAL